MKRARNEELRTKRNLAESNMTISEHRMAIAELKAALAHRTEVCWHVPKGDRRRAVCPADRAAWPAI